MSMKCMRRPPSRLPRGLASLGNTTSAISDCDAITGRGVRSCGLMLGGRSGRPAFQVGFQVAGGHGLHPRVRMSYRPLLRAGIVFQKTMRAGAVADLADVTDLN